MKIRVVIEYDPEAKAYSATCPELPDCTSAGDTDEEALKGLREAIEPYLEPRPLGARKGTKTCEVEIACAAGGAA